MTAVKKDANCLVVKVSFVYSGIVLQPQLKNGTHSSRCFYNRFISNGIPLPSIYSQHFTYSLYPLVQNYKLIITHLCLPPDSCFPISYPFLHQTLFRKESLQQLQSQQMQMFDGKVRCKLFFRDSSRSVLTWTLPYKFRGTHAGFLQDGDCNIVWQPQGTMDLFQACNDCRDRYVILALSSRVSSPAVVSAIGVREDQDIRFSLLSKFLYQIKCTPCQVMVRQLTTKILWMYKKRVLFGSVKNPLWRKCELKLIQFLRNAWENDSFLIPMCDLPDKN